MHDACSGVIPLRGVISEKVHRTVGASNDASEVGFGTTTTGSNVFGVADALSFEDFLFRRRNFSEALDAVGRA